VPGVLSPSKGEPGNPQSLNRYAYVNHNPLRYTDPSGHYLFEKDPSDPWIYSDPEVRSQHYYTHPEYKEGQTSTAEFLVAATSPIWVPVGVVGAEALFSEVAAPAAETGWSWLIKMLGLTCMSGDRGNEVTYSTKLAKGLSAQIEQLPNEIAATFRNAQYEARILKRSLTVYRAEGTTYGRWFGTVKPDSAAAAEQLYNVTSYGNDLTQVSTYRIPPRWTSLSCSSDKRR